MLSVIPVYIEECASTHTENYKRSIFLCLICLVWKIFSHILPFVARPASALSSAETVQSGTVITSSVSQLVPNDSPLVLGNYRSPDENVVTKASLLHFGKKVKIQIFTVRSCRDIIILSQTQMYIYQKSKHIVSFKILLHCV